MNRKGTKQISVSSEKTAQNNRVNSSKSSQLIFELHVLKYNSPLNELKPPREEPLSFCEMIDDHTEASSPTGVITI